MIEYRREYWIMEFQKEFNYQSIANTSMERENIARASTERSTNTERPTPTPPPVAHVISPAHPFLNLPSLLHTRGAWWIDLAFKRDSTRPGVAI